MDPTRLLERGKRVACITADGSRIEGRLRSYDGEFNVALDSATEGVIPLPGQPLGPPTTASAPQGMFVRGTTVVYVECGDD